MILHKLTIKASVEFAVNDMGSFFFAFFKASFVHLFSCIFCAFWKLKYLVTMNYCCMGKERIILQNCSFCVPLKKYSKLRI